MIVVKKVSTQQELDTVFLIREMVFVKEQNVDAAEEYDAYEDSSTHFLAIIDELPAGTARWRRTTEGIKLERFAVLKSQRGKGLGQALVKRVLEDIGSQAGNSGKTIYLHAQLDAVSLYEKFGFKKEGEQFLECNIAHYTMKK